MDKTNLQARVHRITDLLAAPDVVENVRRVADNEHHTAADLAEEIARDAGLAARVLKVVNSGFFAFSQPVTTITHAMVLLGSDVVKALVLTAPVFELFGKARGLWEHSLATARAASTLAEELKFKEPEELGLAGLFHDVGKVILADEAPAAVRQVNTIVRERDMLISEAEAEVIGFTHADVGSWLLQRWSLSPTLTAPVADHHKFDRSRPYADRTAIVHVADVLARAHGIGDPGDTKLPAIIQDAWDLLGLNMTHAKAVFEELDALRSDLAARERPADGERRRAS